MGVQSQGSACYGLCALYRKAIPLLGLARVFDFVAKNYFLALKYCALFFFSIWSEKSTLGGQTVNSRCPNFLSFPSYQPPTDPR